MEWQTDKRLGVFFGIAIIIAVLLFDIGVLLSLRNRMLDVLMFLGGLLIFVSLPIMGIVIYRLNGLLRSGYGLDRNQLTIFWGATRHIVPLRKIDQIVSGEDVSPHIRFRGGRWPGMWIGQGDVPEIGLTLFNTSAALNRQLLIITDLAAYAISPIDHVDFIEAFEARRAMGPTQDVLQESIRPTFFDWPLWTDRVARRLILIAGLMAAVLFFYISLTFPDLPDQIVIHFDVNGNPDRLDSTTTLLIVPFIGILAMIINTILGVILYTRERVAAYLLWGGMILIQGMLWVATLMLLN